VLAYFGPACRECLNDAHWGVAHKRELSRTSVFAKGAIFETMATMLQKEVVARLRTNSVMSTMSCEKLY
jgi:hypothetical protein